MPRIKLQLLVTFSCLTCTMKETKKSLAGEKKKAEVPFAKVKNISFQVSLIALILLVLQYIFCLLFSGKASIQHCRNCTNDITFKMLLFGQQD